MFRSLLHKRLHSCCYCPYRGDKWCRPRVLRVQLRISTKLNSHSGQGEHLHRCLSPSGILGATFQCLELRDVIVNPPKGTDGHRFFVTADVKMTH